MSIRSLPAHLVAITLLCSTSLQPGCRGSKRPAPDGDAGLVCSHCGACEETLSIATALHKSGPLEYDAEPPVGGPHNACWAAWGVHDEVVAESHWVHNLEHGGIVLLYRCDSACDRERTQLAEFVAQHGRTLLTPDPKLPARFAIIAWGHRLVADCLDLAAYQAFYDAHADRAPESDPDGPPAQCAEFPDL